MAASTAFTVATGSTSFDFSALSSKAAFCSSNGVQGVPVTRPVTRVAGIRASSNNSEEARPARREVLAGILATGAALGFSQRASADPIADAQGVVEEAGLGIKRRIDGLFGKDKPYPQRNTQVTGKGAIADAKNRVNNFLNKSQNPLASNIEKATKETEEGLGSATGENSASARAGKEFLGQDSTRVDEATARVNAGAEKLKGKAVQAFDDAKSVAGAAKDAAPDVSLPSAPSLPSLPELPSVPQLPSQGSDLVKGLANKVDEAKSALPGQ